MKTCPKCGKQFNPSWDKRDNGPVVSRMRETGMCWFCSAGINMERSRRKHSGPPPAAQPDPGTSGIRSSLRVTTKPETGKGGGTSPKEK